MKSPYQVPYMSILQEQPLRGDLDLVAEGFVWVLSASLMCAVIHNTTLHSLVIRVYPVTGGTSRRTLLEGHSWPGVKELLLLTTPTYVLFSLPLKCEVFCRKSVSRDVNTSLLTSGQIPSSLGPWVAVPLPFPPPLALENISSYSLSKCDPSLCV